MAKIHVEWKGNMIFEGKDSDGHSIVMDASAIYGGSNQGNLGAVIDGDGQHGVGALSRSWRGCSRTGAG